MGLLIPDVNGLRRARPFPYPGMPFHLTGSCTIQPNANGAPNIGALRAPDDAPIVVNAIKFQIMQPQADLDVLAVSNTSSLGYIVAFSMALARISGDEHENYGLTTNRAFIAAVCPAVNRWAEMLRGLSGSAPYQWPRAEHRIDLTFPVYVPSGWMLVTQLYHTGGIYWNGSVQTNVPRLSARVSYSASRLNSARDYTDEMVYLPFFANYAAAGYPKVSPASYRDQSPEDALANTTKRRVTITSLIGKLVSPSPSIEVGAGPDIGPGLKIRIAKSNGDPIVRDYTPFRSVFERTAACWPCHIDLEPGEFLKTHMTGQDVLSTVQSSSAPALVYTHLPYIGATGYSTVHRSELEG